MTKTSIGVHELRTRIADKAKAEPHHRFWGLYTHVWKLDLLDEAYRLAKANNGAPGVDGVTFERIEDQGRGDYLKTLSTELQEKRYRPLPCRRVNIPKEGNQVRGLKIPAIRDRVVQGALRLLLEPIFEADFQPGSYGYRPGKRPHAALDRVRDGLYGHLHHVIDLDLKSFFDTVRHDIVLKKLAVRIQDADIMWLCKRILKASGRRGLPQGSVIGPLWANVYLNDVDKMLERAQVVTRQGHTEVVRYARFADDIVVLVSNHPGNRRWPPFVEKRLREEFGKLDLTVNEEKSRVVNFSAGEPFDFLGYAFRWVNQRGKPSKKLVLCEPQKSRSIRLVRSLRQELRRHRSRPIEDVVAFVVNPRVRGWVNYFNWGNAARRLSDVRWRVEQLVRRFASRQRPKRRGGRPWTTWSHAELYGDWGLYSSYQVRRNSVPGGR